MKEIKPYKVVLYVAGVLLLLAPVVFFVPEDGFDLGGPKINFLSLEDFIEPKKQEKADVTDILMNIDTTMVETPPDPLVKHQDGSNGDLGAPGGESHAENLSTELQMSDAGRENLNSFFKKLSGVAANRSKMSILHYGDSQIEGDRMTSYIRNKIQLQFGGYGPGLIPATNVYNSFTFKQTYSESFTRYIAFGNPKLESGKYGVMASASRFTPEYVLDSTLTLDSLEIKTGWIEFSPSNVAYARAKKFNNVKLHYNSCIAPTSVKVYRDGALIHEDSLIMDGAQHSLKLSFTDTPGALKYEFSGKISPNICAFSLEGDYGVQVSNIAMRGSSGTVFSRMNSATLGTMYNEINTDLVIMQFGGNSVPFFEDSLSVRNFASYFKSQINKVKRLNPGVMIVVIGPSDMSVLEDGIYNTYEFLPYCVEEMQKVTESSGGAFWSLYAAMGGHNSMPSWVEKGIAGKDYIHFSNGGAKIASQMFYNAFIAEYDKWKTTP